ARFCWWRPSVSEPISSSVRKADAPYPGLGEQRHQPCFGLQRGGLPVSLPDASGTRLCGSNHRLPGPGLRQALCSALSGLSSPSESERPPFLPHSHSIARGLTAVYHATISPEESSPVNRPGFGAAAERPGLLLR